MSEPLLSMRDGLYIVTDTLGEPPVVDYELHDGLKLKFRRPLKLPVFGRCGPLADEVVTIETTHLLGTERKGGDRLCVLYADHETKKLRKTPWLGGSALEAVAAYVEAICTPRRKHLLLIVNPKSGQANAAQLVERECLPILRAAGAEIDLVFTEAPKHATRIIEEHRNLDMYDVVMSAGGDGTFHELLAGLLSREDWRAVVGKVCLLQVPCGSGNALAASSGHRTVSQAAFAAVRGTKAPLDITSIIQPATGKRYFSFLSVTFGLIANLDIGTEHLRWMGAQRFVWGAIREILAQRTYAARVSILGGEVALSDPSRVPSPASTSGTGKYPELSVLGPLLGEDTSVRLGASLNTSSWENIDGDFQLFSIANLPWLDMNFHLHPNSMPGSVNFVYCLGKQGVVKGFELMTGAEAGKHITWSWVHERQVTAFRMEPIAEDTWLVVDGEAIERATIYGEVHKGLVQRLV